MPPPRRPCFRCDSRTAVKSDPILLSLKLPIPQIPSRERRRCNLGSPRTAASGRTKKKPRRRLSRKMRQRKRRRWSRVKCRKEDLMNCRSEYWLRRRNASAIWNVRKVLAVKIPLPSLLIRWSFSKTRSRSMRPFKFWMEMKPRNALSRR